jgi:3-phosphoshikimate 1-carboxyvinyltransferase
MLGSVRQYPDVIEIRPVTKPVSADVVLPGSKSYTNRALPIAALAQGSSTISGALFSDDTVYMGESLRRLGIPVHADEAAARFTVEGSGGRIPANEASLFVGNSGTSARFLTAMLALGDGVYTLDGVERTRQRPIEPLLDALRRLGVDARSKDGTGCPPVVVRTHGLRGGRISMAGDTSSQYFSALMMVAPVTAQGIEIDVDGDLVSKPYIDLTVQTMAAFGAAARVEDGYRRLVVAGGQRYVARTYHVEPDASAASYFFALAAATRGRVRVHHLGRGSAQGDVAFLDVLEQMGCVVERGADFLEVRGPERLAGVDVDMNAISDTVPTLAAIAPLATSPVRIRNVEHIRHKETDRITAVVTELRKLGCRVEEQRDGLIVSGGTLRGGLIRTYDDHRMAMSFAILGTRVPGIRIDDPGCVAKTFPDFFDRLDAATA